MLARPPYAKFWGGSHSDECNDDPMSGRDGALIDREEDRPLAQIDGRIPASCGVPQDRRGTSDLEDNNRHVFETWHSGGGAGLTAVSYGARSAMERGV